MAEEVKLFGVWGSPFSRRVEFALKLKGVQYEFIEEDLSNKSDLLLKYNPVHKKIPVLLHNGKPIAESLVILEYIDETWKGTPILPEHPYQRAMARFWAKFLDEKCLPAIWKSCWSKGEEQEQAMEEACENLKILENELKGKKFFGGETIGLVDIVANFIGFWVGVIQEASGVELVTQNKFPILCKWMDEFVNCKVIKENLPPRDKLVAFFQARYKDTSA
uniref:glutathione transferase n=1 Tax=Davidia involucrata TaxID=16924 RepID=A0A5B7CD02_DAVIN